MKKVRGAVAAVFAVSGVMAAETVNQAEFEALQAEVSSLKQMLHENQVKPTERLQADVAAWGLPEGLELGGVVEVEAGYSRTGSDDTSDITLATVELAAGWQFADWIRGDLVFLYEEDDTPFDVDQAFVTFGNTDEFPLYLQLGKMYVPFGNFDSVFVSDPVVLELAESLETAATLGVEASGFNASVSVFNGDVETDDDDHVGNFVLAASYGIERDDSSIAFGGAWIRNIADSDGLTGILDDEFGYSYTAGDVAGLDLWVTATMGRLTLIAEYVKALDEVEVDGAPTGFAPESLNLELGFALTDSVEIGAKYEKSDDVADWYAEQRYGVVCGYTFPETGCCLMGLSFEYMHEEFENAGEGDLITAQLALGF